MSSDIRSHVTSQVLDLLNRGVRPWHVPFQGSLPWDVGRGTWFRGANAFHLAFAPQPEQVDDPGPLWLDRATLKVFRLAVRRGERPSQVLLGRGGEPSAAPGTSGTREVFRLDQVVPDKAFEDFVLPPPTASNPLRAAERIVRSYAHGWVRRDDGVKRLQGNPGGPRVRWTCRPRTAVYRPQSDDVFATDPQEVPDRHDYYAMLFRALAHSTGYARRLDRLHGYQPEGYGTDSFDFEQLVAELTAAILCAHAGIRPAPIQCAPNYSQSWARTIRSNPGLWIEATEAAQRAADFILGERRYRPFHPGSIWTLSVR